MALQHFSKVFAVKDAKVAQLTSDPANGQPVYGDEIDVPGIKSVTISGSVEVKTLRGDNTLLDSDSVLTEVTVSIEYAKLSLDVLGAVMSAPVVDEGEAPEAIARWSVTGETKPMPFRLRAVSVSADTIGGDVLFSLHKVIPSSFPDMGLAEEDYQTHSLEGTSMPLLSNGKWLDVELRETAAPLGE